MTASVGTVSCTELITSLIRIFDEENKETNKTIETKTSNIRCICGEYLMQIQNATKIYGSGVICDLCYQAGGVDDTFWHCNAGQIQQHPQGYDICDNCIKRDALNNPTNIDKQLLSLPKTTIIKHRAHSNKTKLKHEPKDNLPIIMDDLLQLSEESREKGIKLIIQIFDNIMNYPDNLKYQDLNLAVIHTKLENATTFKDLLSNAGFKQSSDGKRLLYDMKRFRNLYMIKTQLLLLSQEVTNENRFTQHNHYDDNYAGPIQCDGIASCEWLDKLKNIMKLHNDNKLSIEEINIGQVLDHFLHAVTKHNTDPEFELIYNTLGPLCDINTCNYFKRNHRNRGNDRSIFGKTNMSNDIAFKIQILDKIHCYYRHCYDIGYKLTSKEQQVIDNVVKNTKDDVSANNYLLNRKVIKLMQILLKKYKLHRSDRMTKFYSNFTEIKTNQSDNKEYNVGVVFGYKQGQKYNSLKEEMVTNELATINIDQFSIEYHKAKVHYSSLYCKQYMNDYNDNFEQRKPDIGHNEFGDPPPLRGRGIGKHKVERKQLLLHHLLSVIIYCNYDGLQYEFTKTYRKINNKETYTSVRSRHSNFFWLGKYLKECVNWFGYRVDERKVDAFYHGIGEQLFMPHHMDSCNFRAPLSTSTSFAVAANFTNHSQGIIITFNGKDKRNDKKYFMCNWLSDYGNEQECLFIQHNYFLRINNITQIMSGTEYDQIIRSIRILKDMKVTNIEKEYLNESLEILTTKLVHHRLSNTLNGYESFQSLQDYANQSLNIFCINKTSAIMDLHEMSKQENMFLYDLFCYKQHKWIRMDLISTLFPNIGQITVDDVNLSLFVMDNILEHLKSNSQICSVTLTFNENRTDIAADSACQIYKSKFQMLHFEISSEKHWKKELPTRLKIVNKAGSWTKAFSMMWKTRI